MSYDDTTVHFNETKGLRLTPIQTRFWPCLNVKQGHDHKVMKKKKKCFCFCKTDINENCFATEILNDMYKYSRFYWASFFQLKNLLQKLVVCIRQAWIDYLTFESTFKALKQKGLPFKVHISWEGHKILQNLHLTFDCMYYSQK